MTHMELWVLAFQDFSGLVRTYFCASCSNLLQVIPHNLWTDPSPDLNAVWKVLLGKQNQGETCADRCLSVDLFLSVSPHLSCPWCPRLERPLSLALPQRACEWIHATGSSDQRGKRLPRCDPLHYQTCGQGHRKEANWLKWQTTIEKKKQVIELKKKKKN